MSIIGFPCYGNVGGRGNSRSHSAPTPPKSSRSNRHSSRHSKSNTRSRSKRSRSPC